MTAEHPEYGIILIRAKSYRDGVRLAERAGRRPFIDASPAAAWEGLECIEEGKTNEKYY